VENSLTAAVVIQVFYRPIQAINTQNVSNIPFYLTMKYLTVFYQVRLFVAKHCVNEAID
jgi:hypothetical protein